MLDVKGESAYKKTRIWPQKMPIRVLQSRPKETQLTTAPVEPQPSVTPETVATSGTQPAVTPEPELTVTLKPQPALRPKELQPAVTPEESKPAVTPEPQPAVTPEELQTVVTLKQQLLLPIKPQQAADGKTSGKMGAYLEKTQQNLILIPELELHWFLGEKDQKMATLVKENVALVNEVEQLKKQLKNQTTKANQEKVVYLAELSKKEKTERNAVLKNEKLEKADKTGQEKQKEAETHLAQQIGETSRAKAALAQAEKDLNNERQQWQEEKSHFLDSITTLKKASEEKEEERTKSMDGLMERLMNLESQMENVEKKTKEEISEEKIPPGL